MQRIVDKYPVNCSCYLLPIIRESGLDERQVCKNVGYNINHGLKKIAEMISIKTPLTMYVARHSWASIAEESGIPVSVISQGMGHDSETTTRIYLASIDNTVVDNANAVIMARLTG